VTVAVVTDSTADLPADLTEPRGIAVVPLTVHMDGKSYLDGVEITAAEFYERMAASSQMPTTSQPSPGQFEEVYRRLLKDHDEVVSIHISEKLSGTVAAAQQGAELAGKDRIHVLNSEVVSMSLGLLILAASDLAARGEPPARILEQVTALRDQIRTYFTLSTLENLRRGGRIGRANALLGSVLQVKPILTLRDGVVTPLERVRTLDKAVTRLTELALAVDTGKGLCAVVGHAATEETAMKIARSLEIDADTLLIQPLGPVVGTHAGAGTVGVGCYPAEIFPLGIKAASFVSA
jgi:DegV family protein with EDD domain